MVVLIAAEAEEDIPTAVATNGSPALRMVAIIMEMCSIISLTILALLKGAQVDSGQFPLIANLDQDNKDQKIITILTAIMTGVFALDKAWKLCPQIKFCSTTPKGQNIGAILFNLILIVISVASIIDMFLQQIAPGNPGPCNSTATNTCSPCPTIASNIAHNPSQPFDGDATVVCSSGVSTPWIATAETAQTTRLSPPGNNTSIMDTLSSLQQCGGAGARDNVSWTDCSTTPGLWHTVKAYSDKDGIVAQGPRAHFINAMFIANVGRRAASTNSSVTTSAPLHRYCITT